MRSAALLPVLALAGSAFALSVGADANVDRPATWQVRRVRMQLPARVRLAGGWFEMGSDASDVARALALCGETPDRTGCDAAALAVEQPAQRVFVRPYAIDRTEVSNADYQRCVSAGRCDPPQLAAAESQADRPVTGVSWRDARAYCHFAGGELPTEAQWEFAARGGSKRMFPWGMVWNDSLANFARPGAGAGSLDPVDAHPDGKSFFGLLNMAGNVAELVLDHFAPGYDASRERIDPEGPSTGPLRVLRGGSFRSPPQALRVSHRQSIAEDEARPDVGLRCAYRAAANDP